MIIKLVLSLVYVCALFTSVFTLGYAVISRMTNFRSTEDVRFHCSFIFGSIVFMYLFYLLGFAGLFRSWLLVGFVVLMNAVFFVSGAYKALAGYFNNSVLKGSYYRILIVFLLFLCAAVIYSYSPSTMFDELSFHFKYPRQWLASGGISYDLFDRYEQFYPTGMWLFYLFGFAVDATGAASKLVNVFFSVFIFLAVYHFAERVFKDRRTAALPALLFVSMPLIVNFCGTGYPDMGCCYFSLAAFWAMYVWLEEKRELYLVLAGLATGLSLLTKFNGVSVLALCSVVIVAGGISYRNLLLYAMPALAVFSIHIVRNYAVTGNPLYPFMFLDLRYDPVFSDFITAPAKKVNALMAVKNLYRLLLPKLSPHSVGLNFVLLPLFLFFKKTLNKKMTCLFLVYLLYVVIDTWVSKTSDPKYFLPGFVFAALITSAVLQELFPRLNSAAALVLVLPGFLYAGGLAYKRLPLYFGTESRDAFVRQRYPGTEGFDTVQWCNRNLKEGSILYFENHSFAPLGFYYDTRLYVGINRNLDEMPLEQLKGELLKRNIRYIFEIKNEKGYDLAEKLKKNFKVIPIYDNGKSIIETIDLKTEENDDSRRTKGD
jgi:4-amino-4-deoxy-L-arabinose transferase-like glycosyltransferase